MRAFNLVLVATLAALWVYFFFAVAPLDGARPVPVPADGAELSAATLNNEGVRLDREGRRADALAHFERALDFRPRDPVLAENVARQRARVAKRGWVRALAVTTTAAFLWLGLATVLAFVRWISDSSRLHRIRLRGDPWIPIPRGDRQAEMPLRFSEPVDALVRRHPLTIVWSSAAHGKHMKSRPPVSARGPEVTVRLDEARLERLRRYPGDWRAFLYLGKRPVGEAAARVI